MFDPIDSQAESVVSRQSTLQFASTRHLDPDFSNRFMKPACVTNSHEEDCVLNVRLLRQSSTTACDLMPGSVWTSLSKVAWLSN